MPIYALFENVPSIDPTAFVHPTATVIGNVKIGSNSTIWPGVVLRGDYGKITVGNDTSIQDNSVVHATSEFPTTIGDRCTIGHIVHLEGCIIEDDSLVGSGSVVLHRARIQSFSLVGANAVVPADMVVPKFAMALGVPAKIFANRVTAQDLTDAVVKYVQNGVSYKAGLREIT